MRFFSFFLVAFFTYATTQAQVMFNISQKEADSGTEVNVDFVVSNFSNIIGVTIPIKWDRNVIQLVGVNSVANLMGFAPTDNNFGIAEGMATGQMICNWDSPGFEPRSLPNGTVLFSLTFNVVGNPGQFSDIEIFDDLNNNPGFVNADFDDVGFTQVKGRVTVTGMGGGALRVFASDELGTTGASSCVRIRANNFTNVGGFQFAVTWNPAFMTLPTVSSPVLPGFGGGDFSIDNSRGVLLVNYTTSGGLTYPNGTAILELCFQVTGNSGCSPVNITDLPEEFYDIVFSTPGGMSIPFTTGNGSVCIDGEPDCIPEGFTFVFDRENVMPGETFCYPVKVANFTDILSVQFCLTWDPTKFRYIEPSAFFLPGVSAANNFNLIEPGVLAFLWASPNAQPNSIDDFGSIFSICFEAIGEDGDCTQLDLDPSCLVGISIVDGNDMEVTDISVCKNNLCISEEVEIVVSLDQVVNVTCPGTTTGGIAIEVVGGTFPYTFEWRRVGMTGVVGTGQNLTNVGPGQYTVTVTDANGNTGTAGPFTINTQFSINVAQQVVNPLCEGDDNGSISLTITGNTGTITNIDWTPGPSGPTQTQISNLSAGNYAVLINFGQNCVFERTITVMDGSSPEVNASVDVEAGDITLMVSGGAQPYEFLWSDNSMEQNRIGLPAGTYIVTVTDMNGCETTAGPFVIEDVEPGVIVVTSTVSDYNGFGVSCNGTCDGSINLSFSNGTAPYTVSWSDGSGNNTMRANLCAGNYSFTVTDAVGTTASGTINISTPTRIQIEIVDFVQSTMDNGSAIVSASGGIAPYNYIWNDQFSTNGPQLVNQPAEVRVVTVTDANGCTRTLAVNFAQSLDDDCYDNRKVITPNGDGLNDELIITCLLGKENQLDIFDRYGRLVFSARNYANDWMGTHSDGTALPDGAYFFVLKVVEDNGIERSVRNSFNILKDLK